MKEVMSILDKFKLPDLGVVISGVNPALDQLENEKIEKLIGKNIIIRKPSGSEIKARVKGIDVSSSMIGKKNISIQLEDIVVPEEIEVNSTVYGTGSS
ncbi:hypothetical protein [Candidatus Entotheonella palauensis]|nr:hypothetical protein [Candidatus Entotheonella palauensis]